MLLWCKERRGKTLEHAVCYFDIVLFSVGFDGACMDKCSKKGVDCGAILIKVSLPNSSLKGTVAIKFYLHTQLSLKASY